MSTKLLLSIFSFLCALHTIQAIGGVSKTWTYYFISIETTSSNTELLDFDLKVERMGRGEFAITGKMMVNTDVQDNTQIEVQSFRSATGSSEYTPLPFRIPRKHIYEFFNTFYKEMAMKSLVDCSNMPQFEDKFEPPLEKKTYEFNRCELSTDAMPQHMQEGYYKIQLIGYGEVEWLVEVLVKIEKKIT